MGRSFFNTRNTALDSGSATVPVAPFGVPPNGSETGANSQLRPRPETIKPGGKEGRLRVAERKRGGAQRVGLQRRPGPQVGRSLNDHHLAGWTPRSESELAIGGVADIGNGERLAQNCLH